MGIFHRGERAFSMTDEELTARLGVARGRVGNIRALAEGRHASQPGSQWQTVEVGGTGMSYRILVPPETETVTEQPPFTVPWYRALIPAPSMEMAVVEDQPQDTPQRVTVTEVPFFRPVHTSAQRFPQLTYAQLVIPNGDEEAQLPVHSSGMSPVEEFVVGGIFTRFAQDQGLDQLPSGVFPPEVQRVYAIRYLEAQFAQGNSLGSLFGVQALPEEQRSALQGLAAEVHQLLASRATAPQQVMPFVTADFPLVTGMSAPALMNVLYPPRIVESTATVGEVVAEDADVPLLPPPAPEPTLSDTDGVTPGTFRPAEDDSQPAHDAPFQRGRILFPDMPQWQRDARYDDPRPYAVLDEGQRVLDRIRAEIGDSETGPLAKLAHASHVLHTLATESLVPELVTQPLGPAVPAAEKATQEQHGLTHHVLQALSYPFRLRRDPMSHHNHVASVVERLVPSQAIVEQQPDEAVSHVLQRVLTDESTRNKKSVVVRAADGTTFTIRKPKRVAERDLYLRVLQSADLQRKLDNYVVTHTGAGQVFADVKESGTDEEVAMLFKHLQQTGGELSGTKITEIELARPHGETYLRGYQAEVVVHAVTDQGLKFMTRVGVEFDKEAQPAPVRRLAFAEPKPVGGLHSYVDENNYRHPF